jgi:hypothetical protein
MYSGFIGFIRGMLSEPDGRPSSTRVLMFVFSGFTCWLLWRIFWHIFGIADTTQLTIWLSNMPILITVLMGLITLPYTINQGALAVTNSVKAVAARSTQANSAVAASIDSKLTDIAKKVQGAIVIPAPEPAHGSEGPKG